MDYSAKISKLLGSPIAIEINRRRIFGKMVNIYFINMVDWDDSDYQSDPG